MASFFQKKPGWFPTTITIVAVILCTGLGIWQLQRMSWKAGIVEMIETRSQSAPVALPAQIEKPSDWEYRPVRVMGTFNHEQESYLQAQSRNGNFGYQVITPLERPDGTTVLINRGWVPFEMKAAETRAQGQVMGSVTIIGLVRIPWDHTWIAKNFVIDNDPEGKNFFNGALDEMAAAHGIDVLPIFVDADETLNPGGWPKGGQTVLKLIDNHLSYAIQWFLLAITALVIFVLYHRRKDAE